MADDPLLALQKLLATQAKANTATPIQGPGTPGYIAAKTSAGFNVNNYDAPDIQAPSDPAYSTGVSGFLSDLFGTGNVEGVGSAALDLISRPLYGVENYAQEKVRDAQDFMKDPSLGGLAEGLLNPELGQLWQGISGQQKITTRDVANTAVGQENFEKQPGWAQFVETFAGDVLLDPTTYIGVGLIGDAVKGGVKGVKAISGGAKAADEIAQATVDAGREAAITKRIKYGKPEESGQGTLLRPKVMAGLKDETAGAPGQQTLFDMQPTALEKPATDQLDLFDQADEISPTLGKGAVQGELLKKGTTTAKEMRYAKGKYPIPPMAPGPVVKALEGVKEIIKDTPPAESTTITPSTKGMLDKIVNFSQAPVPATAAGIEQALEGATKASSDLIGHGAEHGVTSSEHYVTATKGKTLAKKREMYSNGEIRPSLDTPAERAYVNSLARTDLGNPTANFDSPHFWSLPEETRLGSSEQLGTIFTPKGRAVLRPADVIWEALHNGRAAGITGDYTVKLGNGQSKTIAEIAAQTEHAMDDPKFWATALKQAKLYSADPKSLANHMMKQHQQYVKRFVDDVIEDEKTWASRVKQIYPKMTSETLSIVHAEMRKVIDQIVQAGVINAKGLPEQFSMAAEASNQLRRVLTTAIARNATPEELVVDIRQVGGNYRIAQVNNNVAKIANSNVPAEAKAQAAAKAQQVVDEVDADIKEAQDAVEVAKSERMVAAQKSSNAKVSVRQAKNFEGTTPGAEAVIDGTNWGPGLTRDQATGLVIQSAEETLDRMNKLKIFSYNHINQANTINRILAALGRIHPELTDILKKRGVLKGPGAQQAAARITGVVRAVEHQIDEAMGFLPDAWNGAKRSVVKEGKTVKQGQKGWAVGKPGVVQTERTMDIPHNHPFSSARLLDDMFAHDFERLAGKPSKLPINLAAKALLSKVTKEGTQSSHWTDVVSAAIFKDKDSLDRITDPDLREWLLNYDPMPNMGEASTLYSGKLRSEAAAAADSAEKNVGESIIKDAPARSAKVSDEAPDVAKEAIEHNPSGPMEDAEAIGNNIDNLMGEINAALAAASDKISVVAKKEAKNIEQGVKDEIPVKKAKTNKAVAKVSKEAGSVKPKKLKTLSDADAQKPLWLVFKQWFLTHAGQEEFRAGHQSVERGFAILERRNNLLWKRLKTDSLKLAGNDPKKVHQTLRAVVTGDPIPEGMEEIARLVRSRMESRFGSDAVKGYESGNTISNMSGSYRSLINKYLRDTGVKSGKKGKIAQLEAENWQHDWQRLLSETTSSDEAFNLLEKLENAVDDVAGQRIFYSDALSRFGGEGKYAVNHPMLQGVGFSKEIALQLKRVEEFAEQLRKPSGTAAREFNEIMRIMKMGMTIFRFGHHLTNLIGDVTLAMLDGVGLRDFRWAAHQLKDRWGTDLDPETGVMLPKRFHNMGSVEDTMNEILNPSTSAGSGGIKVGKTGLEASDDQVVEAAKRYGIIYQSAEKYEDLIASEKEAMITRAGNAMAPVGSPHRAVGSKIYRGVSLAAEERESFVRLAHFRKRIRSTAVKRKVGEADDVYMKRVFDDAARETRTYHPDGTDLTPTERKLMRPIFPFYSWFRKATPLLLTRGPRRPGVLIMYPKMMYDLTEASGTDLEGFGSLPKDRLLPSWMQNDPSAAFLPGNTVLGGPGTPATELITQANDPQSALFGQMNPLIKAPIELLQGKTLGDQYPVHPAEYVGENVLPIPGLNPALRGATNKNPNNYDFLNWFGARLQDADAYAGSAHWTRQEELNAIKNRNK